MKLLFAAFLLASTAWAQPELGAERVVLHTVAGDVVLAFYPKVAPKTSAQLLTLFRAGVYDTTHFFRVEPNFVLQTSTAQERQVPLTPHQTKLVKRLPTEVSALVKHVPWRLSMARVDGDWESSETSFSIVLGESPHLDGQYTIFGEVVDGFEAVQELLRVNRTGASRPVARLSIERTTVYDSALGLANATLAKAHPVTVGMLPMADAEKNWRLLWGGGLLVMLLIAALAYALRMKLSSSQLVALHLLQALIAGFYLMALWLPLGQRLPWLGAALFALLVVLFKGMNRFEART